MKWRCVCLTLGLLAAVSSSDGADDDGAFVAYSLRVAQQQSANGAQPEADLNNLGGMTSLAGMVYDAERQDLVLVGQVDPQRPPIHLNELVTALRTVLIHNELPLVSIDRTPETSSTKKQAVNFGGHLEDSEYGNALLAADVALKNIALGLLPADIWGVTSYFSNYVARAEQRTDDVVATRFWFEISTEPSFAKREGVFVIREMHIGVKAEVLYAMAGGKAVEDLSGFRDESADEFVTEFMAAYPDLCAAYPQIGRVKSLLDMAALAMGIKEYFPDCDVNYWLKAYEPSRVATPREYELLTRTSRVAVAENRTRVVELSGGIKFDVKVARLKAGDVTALRELVLDARPSSDALTWHVPLAGWRIPSDIASPEGNGTAVIQDTASPANDGGCSIRACIYDLDNAPPIYERPISPPFAPAPQVRPQTYDRPISPPVVPTPQVRSPGYDRPVSPPIVPTPRFSPPVYERPISPPVVPMPRPRTFESLPSMRQSERVGGVMLSSVARAGSGPAKVALADGSFSLVIDGQNARLSPEAFRKFITALWAVYYGAGDPGISIDPIAPGVNKHMVRYIGKVINTDLGRVMREADYLMKQWAVGTGRPDIRGFQNPDEIAAEAGVMYVGAMSRFWFVPEDMRFRRAGDLLLFDNGRMTVKTEFMFNSGAMHADPANESFARFFTEHYNEIARKHPVYMELFEYAKMVSLAKYLKESGVPLLWFLMANKDLVLTEDSPGTVDALAKGSDYFKNISIEGGVDLATQGQYVYDADAMRAIHEAISMSGPTSTSRTSLGPADTSRTISDRFSFDLGGQTYSVLPQHSLTCGRDRQGIRYQTDIAFRDAGFCLTEEVLDGLEMDITRMIMAQAAARTAQPSDEASEEETRAWYQSLHEKAVEQARPIQARLENLKARRYSSEREFDRAIDEVLADHEGTDWIKPMVIKHAHYNTILELVRYFNPQQRDGGEFGEGWRLMVPYAVRPAGQAKKELNGVLLPEQMVVQNLVTGGRETLTFSTDRYSVAGYVPDKVAKSQVVGLFIMSDASFRLADKLGNDFSFDPAGRLTDMAFSEQHRTHFEYADSFVDSFDRAPYRVEVAGPERVEFRGLSLPRGMTIVDSARGTKEAMVFDPNGAIVGYTPANQAATRFRILALLSDLSLRLLDKKGNEAAFGSDGRFNGFSPSPDNPMIESVSAGPYKVNFEYAVGPSGSPVIASARLTKQGVSETLHAVAYEYDAEGRLCKASPMETHLVAQDASSSPTILLARN